MVVQAVADHDYRFRDICVGWPHDARIFVNSSIYKRITEDKLIDSTGFRTILGQQITPCIIGDSTYPMQTCLLKPFSHSTSLNSQQKILIIDYLEHVLFLKMLLGI